MSRLDYVTIGIVAVCIIALAFLLYKTTNLFGGGEPETPPNTTLTDTTAIDPYAYDDYDTSSILPGADEDLDDNEVVPFEEEPETGANTTASQPSTSTPRASTTTEEPPRTVSAAERSGDYLVLAGSFSVRANAETEVNRLQKMGYTNAEVSPFNRGKFAVVLVDRFTDMTEAQALVKELKAKGVESYVQEKRD